MTVPKISSSNAEDEGSTSECDLMMVDCPDEEAAFTTAIEAIVTASMGIDTMADMTTVSTDTLSGLTEVVLQFSGSDGVLDLSLATAAVSAVQTGSMTPLIKEELKYSIQSKRLAKGKDELEVEFLQPKPELLSEEDVCKRNRRRERNRIAAQKCRNKKQVSADVLEEECTELEFANTTLKDEIANLEEEKQKLYDLLKSHDQFKCELGNLSKPEKES